MGQKGGLARSGHALNNMGLTGGSVFGDIKHGVAEYPHFRRPPDLKLIAQIFPSPGMCWPVAIRLML